VYSDINELNPKGNVNLITDSNIFIEQVPENHSLSFFELGSSLTASAAITLMRNCNCNLYSAKPQIRTQNEMCSKLVLQLQRTIRENFFSVMNLLTEGTNFNYMQPNNPQHQSMSASAGSTDLRLD